MNRVLITSAIPYINGIKHLGNLIGSQLPADLYARYNRARGRDVLFLCATDEHGTPAELAAAKAGQPVDEYCANMHDIQAKIAKDFGLSFDHFGRSSSPQNHKLTQHFAGVLADNGYIYEVDEKQVYSNADGRFLPDRYIEGTCPECGYDKARGDQCENCTKQLDPTDLISPHSAISGSDDLQVRETRHLYLRQSALRDDLQTWIDTRKGWPALTTSIAKKWLNDGDGLQDRGITRDLKWGIPVKRGDKPWKGMEDKVFYVWFDAPIEYIACAMEWAQSGKGDNWEHWWRTDKGADDVRYVQFMGKDNVPFHTLSFPATLIGSKEPWKRVDYIKSFNYLNYEGGQFSTSQGRGIFMNEALDILPADYWRWWLLSNAPEQSDVDFNWAIFRENVNKDLADVLGNFVSRVTKFCQSKFGNKVPQGDDYGDREHQLIADLQTKYEAYKTHMECIDVRKAAKELRAIWQCGNIYMQEAAPWVSFKQTPDVAAMQIRMALNLIKFYAIISAPFIPAAADKMLRAIGGDQPQSGPVLWPDDVAMTLNDMTGGEAFCVPEMLFARITEEQRDEWAAKFSGKNPA